MENIDAKPKKSERKKAKIKSVVTPQKTENKQKEQKSYKKADISSLFSAVKAEKIVHKKQKKIEKKSVDNRAIEKIQKRIKPTKRRKNNEILKKIESLDIDTSHGKKEVKSASTAREVNKVAAKIQSIIYSKFNPTIVMAGSVVTIRLTIDAQGRVVDYRILRYSGNDALNEEAKQLYNRIVSTLFPTLASKESYSVKINLIPEDK